MFVGCKCVKIVKHRIALQFPGIGYLYMVGVGKHTHYPRLNFLGRVGKIDTVAERLTHLRFSVGAGKPQTSLLFGKNGFRLDERFAVNGIEFPHYLVSLLYHRELIFPDGNDISFKSRYIGGLAYRVIKKADGYARLEVAHLNFVLDGGVSL